MADSPTTRTLKRLRDEGWLPAIVEKWNPHARVRQDLYGLIDVLAVRDGETLGVQCTSYTHVAERVRKFADHENTPELRKANWRLEVWGWVKRKNRWEVRIVDVS